MSKSDNPVYRIKPMVWEGNEADAIHTSYRISNGWNGEYVAFVEYCDYIFDRRDFDTIDEAKAWCEQDWQNRITQCLEVVDANQ